MHCPEFEKLCNVSRNGEVYDESHNNAIQSIISIYHLTRETRYDFSRVLIRTLYFYLFILVLSQLSNAPITNNRMLGALFNMSTIQTL